MVIDLLNFKLYWCMLCIVIWCVISEIFKIRIIFSLIGKYVRCENVGFVIEIWIREMKFNEENGYYCCEDFNIC